MLQVNAWNEKKIMLSEVSLTQRSKCCSSQPPEFLTLKPDVSAISEAISETRKEKKNYSTEQIQINLSYTEKPCLH